MERLQENSKIGYCLTNNRYLLWVFAAIQRRMASLQTPCASLTPSSIMANTIIQFAPYASPADDKPQEPIEIDLHEPWLAALLAWVLPGLGHLYQGRTGKGLLFFICVLGTFIYGMYLGEGKVVYASVPGEPQYRWQYGCQLGVGETEVPAVIQRHRRVKRRQTLWQDQEGHGFMAPPRQQPGPTIDDSGHRSTQPNEQAKWIGDMHPKFELGTVYTVIAGLLNVLVICDASAGPLVIVPREDKKKTKQQAENDA